MIMFLQMMESDEDNSKFCQIYNAYKNLLFSIAYRRMGNAPDAEDAVQHVFVKVAENIKRIEPVCPKTKSFVVFILENHITDIFRARSRHPSAEYNNALENERTAFEMEHGNLLSACISKLPEQQKMVIRLKYQYGYDLAEIARMMEISLAWAQKLDQRAKKNLERIYTEGGGDI